MDLIIGASGQVGQHLHACLRAKGRSVTGTCHRQATPDLVTLDIRDGAAVQALMDRLHPGIVFLVAALTNVDYCETHREEAHAINVDGSRNVIRAASATGSRLVFLSSDYVFDGRSGPYAEDASTNPISEYGRQKLMVEESILRNTPDSLIARTTVVYGWEAQGKNFVQRLLGSLRKGERVRVPKDQIGSPTYAPNLSEALAELAIGGAKGVFNLSGPTLASRLVFAAAVAEAFGLSESLIDGVATSDLAQPARRPLKAGMKVGKAQALLKTKLVAYREGLAAMLAAEPKGVPA